MYTHIQAVYARYVTICVVALLVYDSSRVLQCCFGGRLVGWTLLGRRVQGFGLQDMGARSRAVLFAGLGRLCALEAAMRDPQTSNCKSPGP